MSNCINCFIPFYFAFWHCLNASSAYLTRNTLFFRNIDDVDKTMDEINEQTENMKQIQEALATPIGAAADFDEVTFLHPT